jgi:hypothetical protein
MYRNHFVTGQGTSDWPNCNELVAMDLMWDNGPQSLAGGMHCFTVTEKGKNAMLFNSPNPPKVSRSRQRYLSWLRSDCGMTFGEWLRQKHYQFCK